MTASPVNTTTDLHAVIAVLRAERDAALAREVALTEALATRNSEYDERIEQQSATIDVLKVMSASSGDPQPVFDLIVRRATELCNSKAAGIYEYDGELVHLRSDYGARDIAGAATYLAAFPMMPVRGSIACRAILDRQVVHIRDTGAEPELVPIVRDLGIRSALAIPLLRDGAAIGAFIINSLELGGFSDSQVALSETFAEQAVIAITSAETYRALQTRTGDLQETLEYQTATTELLKVISQSTFNLEPVFQTVAATAVRLCNAEQAGVYLHQNDEYRWVGGYSQLPEYERIERDVRIRPGTGTLVGRVALEGRPVHILDALADTLYDAKEDARVGGIHTLLGVPLLRDGTPIGVIGLGRQKIEPFAERQIELVSTFAAQAVIAMENARLLTEQREALEQQTATAEVLQVINASPGNLTPVFDAMLEKGVRLCDAQFGFLHTYDGEFFRAAAMRGVAPALAKVNREPMRPGPGGAFGRLTSGEDIVHISDITNTASYQTNPLRQAFADQGGARTALWVALRKDGTLLGTFVIFRQEVRRFSDKQVVLLKNFAAQAVIAMENARLINEQREALEQQTAAAEVLQVINTSPGNLVPVFDAILEKARDICGATKGALVTSDGQQFRAVATRGLSETYAQMLREPRTTLPGSLLERLASGASFFLDDPSTSPQPLPRAATELEGIRTALVVPLRRDSTLLGYISAYRQEMRAFTDKHIALLQNFAAQAVIAMENARLINETHEALEQQTATAEVLGVINSSPGDLGPVFNAILEKAHALCGAATGSLQLYDGEFFRAVATRGLPDEFASILRQPHRSALRDASLRDAPFVQITDIADPVLTGGDKSAAVAHEIAGVRTYLRVPLRKDDALLGSIVAGRREVRPFSQKEISLLQSFAAQAVIAMENARLLEEIRQHQAELRVTFDNMADGVAMFDGNLRLAAWNHNFQELLDIPAAVLGECPTYAEYLRILSERGEFGTEDIEAELNRRLEHTDRELRLERARPNGQVIEVRRNPVPDGGIVLIYSDITERKRSEAEIRAARDAAEAAYRDLKTVQANLIQAEKMASLGQLTAGIAHEIKNPLNFVNNFAALSVDLLSELKEAAAPGLATLSEKKRAEVEDVSAMLTSNLEKITEHGKRADGIVTAMLEHSRGSSGERRMVDLNALIDEALNLAYHGARAQNQTFDITLERDFGAGIDPIEINPQDITRVLLNLFSNGFYAATRRARNGGDGGLVPTLKVTTSDTGDAVEIRVRDNGTGIPADVRDKLFEPFFTTKPTGEGTGLGLSITYDIVTQQHGGTITADSNVGEYAEFTIRLPRNP